MNPVYDLNLKALKKADVELYKAIKDAPEADIEVIQSKNGHPVPKVANTLIHSSYDPLREASAFVKSYESVFRMQDILLVMGYGFGYHVDEIVAKIKDDPKKFIFVIEPDISFFKKAIHFREITSILDRVTFIVGFSISRLFAIPGFYKILNAAPYTIGYKPVISLNEEYFAEFVERRSSNKVEHLVLEADENKELLDILGRFKKEDELDIPKLVRSILNDKTLLSRSEKIFLLMGELAH